MKNLDHSNSGKAAVLFFSLFIQLFISAMVSAQAPAIIWEKSYGGTGDDLNYVVQQTADQGYMVAGRSFSNDGDVFDSQYQRQAWMIKMNSDGALQWEKTYGGSNTDHTFCAQQTTDGNYFIAIESTSDDGDIPVNYGEQDLVAMKVDENGNPIWTKVYGGTLHDHPQYMSQTNDKGFIITGGVHSNDGDVTGQHHGSTDYFDIWMVKLDSLGNWQWGKSIGGSNTDFALYVRQLPDNSYVVAGQSYSNDGDISGHHGSADFSDVLVMKLDPNGNIIWTKTYGGTGDDIAHTIEPTPDGGYIVIAESNSDDGDVTNSHGGWDYWLLKLDADGNLTWQKSIGGSGNDSGKFLSLTSDGGYILAGESQSNDGDASGNHGDNDCWVVKTDALGNIQWQRMFGGSHDDNGKCVKQTSDGGYVVTATAYSNDGDVTGHIGTTANGDFWTIKLAPDGTAAPTIQTSSLGAVKYCPGDATSVGFTVTNGAFQSGNIFTAQLSDASGNFTNPTAIGTVAGTTSGTIPVTMTSTAKGNAYRIRVVASLPSSIGTDNGSNLIITCPPPTNLSATGITSTTAMLKWKHVNCADKYSVHYRKVGTTTWQKLNATSNFISVTGLIPSTNYQWAASTQCTSDPQGASKNSTMQFFTTLPARLSASEDEGLAINLSVYPNPANNQVVVSYHLVQDGNVQLQIKDITGRIIYAMDNQPSDAGDHQVSVNTSELAAGAYLVQLISGNNTANKELMITR